MEILYTDSAAAASAYVTLWAREISSRGITCSVQRANPMAQCITSCSSSSNRAIKAMAPVGGVDHSAKICQINMKFISLSLLCVLLLSMLVRIEAAPSGEYPKLCSLSYPY